MALINSSNFSGGNAGWELNFLSGWIKHATFNVTLWINGSGATAKVESYGTLGCYYRNETPASADQRIAADLLIGDYSIQSGKSAWVAGRINTAANTMYRAGKVDGFWHIQKVVAGTVTTIGTPVQDFVNNTTQRVTLEIIGTGGNVELKLYKNAEATPITSGTDSSSPITAVGRVGILALNGSIMIDNFQADTIEASNVNATATGATLIGPSTLAPGSATGGAVVDATASGTTLTGTATLVPGAATGGSSGSFSFDPCENNTQSGVLNGIAVNWTWHTGAVGAVTAFTNGSGTITSSGMTISGLPAGAGYGVLRTADGTVVAYQEGTVA